MKQVILNVLEDVSKGQPNLESEAAREVIANLIIDGIEPNTIDDTLIKKTAEGWADVLGVNEEEIERKKWVCTICNKSTWEVDWDYIGSEYNHLGCELEIEMEEDRRKKMKEKFIEESNKNPVPKQHERIK